MSSSFNYYSNIALPVCLGIPRQKKHVSMIFYKKHIISIGTNNFKTHPQAKKIGYMYAEMHSELDAYTKVPRMYKGEKLTLVNVRYNFDGQLRMSRPCALCTPWCKEIFHRIYYTTNDGFVRLWSAIMNSDCDNWFNALAGTRTQNLRLKRPMLYQLSYERKKTLGWPMFESLNSKWPIRSISNYSNNQRYKRCAAVKAIPMATAWMIDSDIFLVIFNLKIQIVKFNEYCTEHHCWSVP